MQGIQKWLGLGAQRRPSATKISHALDESQRRLEIVRHRGHELVALSDLFAQLGRGPLDACLQAEVQLADGFVRLFQVSHPIA